ncbi:MAG: phosphatidate cytidylyltransferase [Candidatus Aminicenantales bacterium]
MSDRQRTPTAVVLLSLLFVLVQWGPDWAFFAVVQAVIAAALWEFYNLARRRRWRPQRAFGLALALLVGATFYFPGFSLNQALCLGLLLGGIYFLVAFNSLEKAAVFPPAFALTVSGAGYVALPTNYLYWIRLGHGQAHLYFFFAVIFLGDTGAFLIGKTFGRRKMAPIASPNKTWEGCAGGLIFALIAAVAARFLFFPAVPLVRVGLIGVIVHAAAQISDPLESLFKRAVGVKDSSNLLPGHGGFLDRIDSFLLAAPLFFYLIHYLWR